MTAKYAVQSVLARVEAGRRAWRLASALWAHDPRRGWRVGCRAAALAFASERRAGVLLLRTLSPSELN